MSVNQVVPLPQAAQGGLVDAFGRVHTNLRVSVTDRCNIRCFYCMPLEDVQFQPKAALMTFEEITRFVAVCASLGVSKIRLTGGEPLVRQGLPQLVQRLSAIRGIDDIALTTNGILLAENAAALKQAGVHRVNISLDALNAESFTRITRRPGYEKVLAGIEAALAAGFDKVKINAVAIRGITEPEIAKFGAFARQHDLEVRFIEYMPLDADGNWDNSQVLSGEEIRQSLEAQIGPLVPVDRPDTSQPAVDFAFADGRGRIGFINPVTQPFCQDCNRLRITAEGQVRNCLFSTTEWDARGVMRSGGSDAELAALVQDCVAHKKAGHGINSDEFIKPQKAMYQIGG